MIREKEKNNKEGRLCRLKKFEEESYREAVSYIRFISVKLPKCMYSQYICAFCAKFRPHHVVFMISTSDGRLISF